ncbi:MAG: PLDc N-terminal domain-containing protein [Candidatus Odinarchaeota archaeon]
MMAIELSEIIILILPVVVIQISLQAFSLWHLWKKSQSDKKPFFGLLIVFLSFIGVAIYWLAGSENIKYSEDIVGEKGAF